MTDTRDTLEKIAQEMIRQIDGHPAHRWHNGPLTDWAFRLRALRERNEKAWMTVQRVEESLRHPEREHVIPTPLRSYAELLRSAREEASGG